MTAAPHDIDPQEFLHEQLAHASPDLLRELMQMFVNALLSEPDLPDAHRTIIAN